MADCYPERLAVWCEDVQRTYAELNQQANRAAQRVLAQFGDPTPPMILLFGHTPAAVIALLAVLKAGRFYTPFDPTQPVAHLAQKASDSEENLLLNGAATCLFDLKTRSLADLLLKPIEFDKDKAKR